MHLDPGERESLALAESVHADRLLLDDAGARREAEARGFTVIGILVIAARDRLIDLNDAYDKLKRTSFHAPESLFQRILAQHEQDRTTLD
jgi:predicted nucleic acid-binding protein